MKKAVSTLPAGVLGAVLALFAAGCASDGANAPASDAPRVERAEAVTGTRIPNRKAAPSQSDTEQREKSVERAKEPQKTS